MPHVVPSDPGPTPPRLRVLLVEDSAIDARIIGAVLDGWDEGIAETCRAETLAQAVRLLRQERFDLILLDLMLPDSTDLDTAMRTLAVSGETPVVVLTSHTSGTLGEAAIKAGAQDFVTKGQATPTQLRRAIRFAVERQRLLARLHATERRHRSLLDRVRVPVCLLDGDLRFLFVNEALARIIDRPRPALIGEALTDFVQPERSTAVQAALAGARDQERTSLEAPIRAADGPVHTIAFVVTACGDGSLEAVGEDLTAFRDPAAAQEVRRAQWRSARELAPEGALMLNGEGQFVAVNAAFCDLVQHRREWLLDHCFVDLLSNAEEQVFARFLDRFRASDGWPRRGTDIGLTLVPDAEGEPFAVSLRSGEGRSVVTELELRRSHDRLEGYTLPVSDSSQNVA